MEERCLKFTALAASSRVVERCCSTVLVMSPSCVCGVVQRGPLTLPAVLGVAAAMAVSCAAAGCWSAHGSVSEAVEDRAGLWLLLHIIESTLLDGLGHASLEWQGRTVTRRGVTRGAHMVEELGLSGAVGSQEGVCCCTWIC